MTQVLKALHVVSYLIVAVSIFSSHLYGSLFPYFNIGILLFSVSVISLSIKNNDQIVPILFTAIFGYLIFYIYLVSFPESLIAVDTDTNAYWMSRITDTGSTEGIGSGFYQQAPFYYIYSSIFVLILDIYHVSFAYLYVVAIGVLMPLVAVSLTKLISNSSESLLQILPVALMSISATTSYYTYGPNAQTHAILLWGLFLLAGSIYIVNYDNRFLWIAIIGIASQAFTHKLLLIVILLVIGSYILLLIMNGLKSSRKAITSAAILCSTMIIIVSIQWMYLTGFISRVVREITIILLGDFSGAGASYTPSMAEQVNPGIIGTVVDYPTSYSFIFEYSNGLFLLMAGGIAWIYVLIYRRKNASFLVLSGAAIPVSFLFLGVISSSAINPPRALFVAELPVIVLISTFIGAIYRRFNWKGAIKGIMVILILTQAFSASAVPDYQNTPRYYLDAPEVEGREFGCLSMQSTITTDSYTNQENYIHDQYCNVYERNDRHPSDGIYSGEINTTTNHLYMTDRDVRLAVESRWKLLWDPKSHLQVEMNRVYSNGQAIHYVPNGQSI